MNTLDQHILLRPNNLWMWCVIYGCDDNVDRCPRCGTVHAKKGGKK